MGNKVGGGREGGREGEREEAYLGLVNGDGGGVVGEEGAVGVHHPLPDQWVEVRGRGRGGSDGLADLEKERMEGGGEGGGRIRGCQRVVLLA